MRLAAIILVLLMCAGCSVPVKNIKKIQYYEPTKNNIEYCVQPSKEDPGHGPLKSIEYEVREKVDFNFNFKNSAVGL